MYFIFCHFFITCLFGAFIPDVTPSVSLGAHYKIFTQPMSLSLLSTICVQNLVKIGLVVFESIKNKHTNKPTNQHIYNGHQTYIYVDSVFSAAQ